MEWLDKAFFANTKALKKKRKKQNTKFYTQLFQTSKTN